MGYSLAGFDVTGVDRDEMPRYPFPFIKQDVATISQAMLSEFDVIAASPPCKTHTRMKAFSSVDHVDMLPHTRELLRASGKPYVIENVPGAPLIAPILLCGSMFGLNVERHRLFESNVALAQLDCRHGEQRAASPGFKVKRYHSGRPVEHVSPVVSIYGRGNGYGPGETELWREVMGMPWASKDGLREAIPPTFTHFIGLQIIAELNL